MGEGGRGRKILDSGAPFDAFHPSTKLKTFDLLRAGGDTEWRSEQGSERTEDRFNDQRPTGKCRDS